MSDNDHDLETVFAADTLIARMQMDFTEVTAERVVGSMPVAGNTQPYGLLHGGASAALAETAGSLASIAHAGAGHISVGVDLNITHHRAVRSGRVHATATALHLGRTTSTHQIVIVDDEGRTVATARLTCAIRAKSTDR